MALELSDIQGNVLRGFRFAYVRHFALGFGHAEGGRQFVAAVVPGPDGDPELPSVTTADEWREKPPHALTAGFTWPGLRALGVSQPVLDAFPDSYRAGAAARAADLTPDFGDRSVGLGDVGDSAPANWIVGGPAGPEVHVLLSLFGRNHKLLEDASADLRTAFGAHGISELSSHDGNALPHGGVHFGYRDGIAQPNIEGAPGRRLADMQPEAGTGDFLLGRDYVNKWRGNFIGDLPAALCDNGTYAAFRILSQDVAGFEALLDRWGREAMMERELVAAKLMGRWRNGTPLTLSPDTADPEPPVADRDIDNFDYAPGPGHPTFYDDAEGLRCPVGAHIRRLNPRGGLAMGNPHSRRLVRRGMPYGPPFDRERTDEVERGLLGLFICGDLELQYEFLLRSWVNEDISMRGLRGSREPILGAQPDSGGRFTIRTADARDPIVLGGLPTLTTTRGSVYAFMPGVGGLRSLAAGGV